MDAQNLFGNYKYCELCRRPLAPAYPHDLCPTCVEQKLFQEVKDYIRENDVTEYDVSIHFQIPLHRVKQWIREGRIEYKEEELNARVTMHCEQCGTPITFGSLCTKCLKLSNSTIYGMNQTAEPTRMRFFENGERKTNK